MTQLKPVPSDYLPTYPRELTEEQIRELLRPSLWQRFSAETLATGALVTGLTLTGCGENAALGQREEPHRPEVKSANEIPSIAAPLKSGKTTSSDPNLKKKVDKLAAEILGDYKKGSWNNAATIRLQRELKANPPIKYPVIPISFGNSYVGIFDTAGAKEATHRMFAAYGIELKKNVTIKGKGYEFVADGYNEELNIGFELVVPEGRVGFTGKELPKQTDAEKLSAKEASALDGDLKAGTLRLFVADAAGFQNMDGDLYTPLEYYLASVVDYLNWVHGDQRIDGTKLLGKLPAGIRLKQASVKAWQAKHPPLPNCGFEDLADLKRWTGDKAKIARSHTWSGNAHRAFSGVRPTSIGQFSLHAHLEPGGTLTYTVPEDQPVNVKQEDVSFGCNILLSDGKRGVKVVLTGDNGETWTINQEVGYMQPMEDLRKKAPFEKLKTVTISVDGDTPAELYLDDLGIGRGESD